MDDYSVFFKDEPSPYVWLPLTKLRSTYVCVEIRNYPSEGHRRLVFWVGSDGVRTMLYFAHGLAEVVSNLSFKLVGVHGAAETEIVGGRVRYRMPEETEWRDLGPIVAGSRLPEDVGIESLRRTHLKTESSFEEEVERQVKEAAKHDFWAKGGSF